ncbi:MAG: hypothetical protein OSB27_01765, partial [Planktomarina sp.]|nr:hypothetical protein [Planktomarina sp.]
MSNSDKSQGDQREKIYSVIWGSLIFVVVVWWFYPQIRSLIQPNRSAEEIVTPTNVVEELNQETSSEVLTIEVLPAAQENIEINSTAEPEIQQVSAPKFDGTRLDADGSLVVYGLAEGFGYVVLSLDGREFPEARADLSGNGKFAILTLLSRKTEPQALQLWLYPEDGTGPIISEGVTFVTLPPEAAAPDASNSVREETDPETDVSEPPEGTLGPAIIVADENGIRVLQDGNGNTSTATVSIDTISYDLQGEVSIGGRATGTGFVRIYINNRLVATSKITNGGYWKADLL